MFNLKPKLIKISMYDNVHNPFKEISTSYPFRWFNPSKNHLPVIAVQLIRPNYVLSEHHRWA